MLLEVPSIDPQVESLASDSQTNLFSLNHIFYSLKLCMAEREKQLEESHNLSVREQKEKILKLESALLEYSLLYKNSLPQ